MQCVIISKCNQNLSKKLVISWQRLITSKNCDIDEFKKIFKAQCPQIWNRYGFEDDRDMIRMMATGYKYNRDYLLDFVDHCAYWRMKESTKKSGDLRGKYKSNNTSISSWIRIMVGISPDTARSKIMIENAVVGFNGRKSMKAAGDDWSGYSNSRSFPMFYFQDRDYLINDSIEMTVRYLCSVCELVERLKSDAPFQIDLCIKYGLPIKRKMQILIPELGDESDYEDSDYYDYDDDDISSEDSYLEDLQNRDLITIKNIGKNISDFDMKYVYGRFGDSAKYFSSIMIINGYIRWYPCINYVIPMDVINLLLIYLGNYQNYELTSCLLKEFNNFREKYDFDPNYKRFVIFTDRRREKDHGKDEIWTYEPYGDNCKKIPGYALSYWYFNSSATSILPSKGISIDSCNSHQTYSMLIFSFHIKSKDCIRCYMYYNNQMVTFFGTDFMEIFKWIFNPDWSNQDLSNQSFAKNKELIQQFVNILDKTIRY